MKDIKFGITLIIHLILLLCCITAQKQANSNKGRKNMVMQEVIGDEEDDDVDYFEASFFEPWHFPENSPSFSYREKIEKDELIW